MLNYVLNNALLLVTDKALFVFIKNLKSYFKQSSLNRMSNYDIADDCINYLFRFPLKSESLQETRVMGEI